MISAGIHRAQCRSVQFGTAKTGTEQTAVEFMVVGEDDQDAGQTITWFGFFTDKTLARTVEAFRHMGWQGDDLAELPVLAEQGKLAEEVEIVVDYEEYEGKQQAKVKWVNRPGGGRVTLERPMDETGLRAFSARMKASVRAAGGPRPAQGNGGGRSAPPQRGGGGGGYAHPNAPGSGYGPDDDIPFASSDIRAEPDPRRSWGMP